MYVIYYHYVGKNYIIKNKTEGVITSALKEWSSIEKGFLKLQSVRFRTVLVSARQKPAKR